MLGQLFDPYNSNVKIIFHLKIIFSFYTQYIIWVNQMFWTLTVNEKIRTLKSKSKAVDHKSKVIHID